MDLAPNRRFSQCRGGNTYFCLVPDAPVVSADPLSFFSFFFSPLVVPQISVWRINYPQLCVSAVSHCLGFARVRPCGCSFLQPSVTRWIEDRGGEWRGSSRPRGHTHPPSPVGCRLTHGHVRSLPDLTGCEGWVGVEPEPCLAAGVSWMFVCRHRGHRDNAGEEKER